MRRIEKNSLGAALMMALLCSCSGRTTSEPFVQSVSLTRPIALNRETSHLYSGIVKAAHEVSLGFKTAGQIARIHVSEGDYVQQGQLLAELDDADYQLAVDALQIQYDQLKDEVERTKQLFNQKSVSANDFEKASAGLRQLGVQLQANRNKLDYTKLKPVLFEFPTYSYLATGEIIGKCLNLDKQPGMCAKEPMSADGIVRLSKIEVYPQYLNEYMKYATEVGEISLRTEPGVLTMYAVGEKENPCKVTILETYASREAYEKHIASEHFQKYKQGTLHMVKSLVLSDQKPLNPANKLNNFMQ